MISRAASGHRCGASHPRAKLSDSEVALMRRLRETEGWKYAALASRFSCGESTVRDIVTYRTRFSA